MKLRLIMTLGMLMTFAILLFAVCDDNNTPLSANDERTTNVPGEPGESALPAGDVKIALLGDFFSNEEGCFWLIVGDSSYYELAFETIGPPRYPDSTTVIVTGEYTSRLGSNCGALGPIISVEDVEPVPEETNSGPETNGNDF